MKRRGFLKIFGKVAAAVTAAPVLAKIPEKEYPWPESKSFMAMGVDVGGDKSEWVTISNSYADPLAKSLRETKERVAADVYNQAFTAGRRTGKSGLTREMIEKGPHEVFGLAADYEPEFKDLFK